MPSEALSACDADGLSMQLSPGDHQPWTSEACGTVGSLEIGGFFCDESAGEFLGLRAKVRPKLLATQVWNCISFWGFGQRYAFLISTKGTCSLAPGLHQARVSPQSPAKSLVPAVKPRCGPSAFDLVKKLNEARHISVCRVGTSCFSMPRLDLKITFRVSSSSAKSGSCLGELLIVFKCI